MVEHDKQIINYAKEDVKKEGTFKLDGAIERIKDVFPKSQYLEVKIEIRSPARALIDSLVENGSLNRNQREALARSMQTEINNAIASRFKNLQPVIHYPIFLGVSNLTHSEAMHGKEKVDLVEFSATCMDVNRVGKLMKLLTFEQLSFCKSVRVEASDENETVLTMDVERTPVKDLYSEEEWEALRKIFYEPLYLKLLSPYLFKNGKMAQITHDCYKDKSIQKRRVVTLPAGSKLRLHDYLTPLITSAEFGKTRELNDIIALYAGTAGTEGDVLHLIVDIDVSKPLKIAFNEQLIWDLVLDITEGIIKACASLGLDKNCAVNFSGSRGTHLIYSVELDAFNDSEKIVNLREFLYQSLPGRRALTKNFKSAFRDKFKLLKTIVQAICLYSVAEGFVEIPWEIRKKLKVTHPKNLFTLTTMPDDEMKVLLDSSPNGRGVFRIFGSHPSSKLMSRAIYNPSTKKFYEAFKNFEVLKQECQVESVLENLQTGDTELFHEPGTLTKEQVRNLFKPDSLYPYVAIILRFGTAGALDLSPYALKWWKRKYANESFFAYLKNEAKKIRREGVHDKGFCAHIVNLAKRLGIEKRKWLTEALKKYLIKRNIEYSTFENLIDALRAHDFHVGLRNMLERPVKLNPQHYRFLEGNIADVFQITMLALVNLRKMTPISPSQVKALHNYVNNLNELIEEARNIAENSRTLSKERKKELFFEMSVDFNDINVVFLKEFYKKNNKVKKNNNNKRGGSPI